MKLKTIHTSLQTTTKMVHPHEIDNGGVCTTCKSATRESQILECSDCKKKYHADCDNTSPFCTKAFLKSFKGARGNFKWSCNHCVTHNENTEASSLKQQMANVVAAVAELTKEVTAMKSEKHAPQYCPEAPSASNETAAKSQNA